MKQFLLHQGLFNKDKVILDVMPNNLRFNVSCDGTGFSFIIDKEKLLEMLKWTRN